MVGGVDPIRVRVDHWDRQAAERGWKRSQIHEDRRVLLGEVDRLRDLIRDLHDPDPCRFDHNGGCQAHGYLSLKVGETCPQRDAQQIVATLDPEKTANA